MKIGIQTGYWMAQPKLDVVEVALRAEKLGYDSIWTGESYSSDAFSPLVWIATQTKKIKVGTGIAQMAARTPASMAMHAMTLDAISGGRLMLGIGVSGPQVVEGWYGQPFGKPLSRTREYIGIMRDIWNREGPVTNHGALLPLPYPADAPHSMGLGKPIKLITTPLRSNIPVLLGAEGPKNIRLSTELCQGWLPLYYSPTRPEVYADAIADRPDDFEIAVNVSVKITENTPEAISAGHFMQKATLGFYIGGMGAKSKNFHTELMARMGYEEEAFKIQELFYEGKRDEAINMVPEAFCDEISLVGPVERIRDKLEAWRESPITTMIFGGLDPATMETMAGLVLGK